MIYQLKTSFTMKDSDLKKTIETEFRFISNLFDQIKQFRQSETVQEKEKEKIHGIQVTNRTGKIKTAKELKEIQRAKTLEELHQRLDSYKASKAVKKGPNYERNLKKKLKKKTKVARAKEERKKLGRQLAKEAKAERRKEEEEKKRVLEAANADKKPKVSEIETKVSNEKPVEAKGSIVFNKIDVADEVKAKSVKDRPQVALEKLEKTQRLISKMKEKGDVEKAAKIQDKMLWSNVLNKAEGIKVKDDKEKIRKSIKRVEDRKKKSEKKWKERIEHTEKQMEMRQKKRKENLKTRKTEKIKKKIKKSIKKGRTLPGHNDK